MSSLADEARAAQVIGRLHYLKAADAVWGAGLRRGQPEELEALGIVVDQLMTTLAALRDDVPFIHRMASELDEEGFDRTLSDPKMPTDLATSFRRLAEENGGFRAFATERLGDLDGVLSGKQDTIGAEYQRMRSGGPRGVSGGSDSDACAIGIAAAVLGGAVSPALSAGGVLLAVLSC